MSEVKVDTISERTAANGVVVDGVTIKDSGVTISSSGTLQVDGTLKAANGILFGTDTAAANTLDDYEQGTWTPTLSASSGSSPTATTVNADYTKIGNLVFISFYILNITAGDDSSAFIKITNLPFSVDLISPTLSSFSDNITFAGGRTMMTGHISSSDYILFRQSGSAVSDTALDNAYISDGVSDVYGSGFYYTNQ
jgi:hypothetical protein